MTKKSEAFSNIFSLSLKLENLKSFKEYLEPLSIKQWFLLGNIINFFDKPSVSEVAKFMGSSHQNIKAIATNLEKKGFVKLEIDNKDKRVTRIIILDKCLEYINSKDGLTQIKLNEVFAGFSEEDLEKFIFYMSKIINNIEE